MIPEGERHLLLQLAEGRAQLLKLGPCITCDHSDGSDEWDESGEQSREHEAEAHDGPQARDQGEEGADSCRDSDTQSADSETQAADRSRCHERRSSHLADGGKERGKVRELDVRNEVQPPHLVVGLRHHVRDLDRSLDRLRELEVHELVVERLGVNVKVDLTRTQVLQLASHTSDRRVEFVNRGRNALQLLAEARHVDPGEVGLDVDLGVRQALQASLSLAERRLVNIDLDLHLEGSLDPLQAGVEFGAEVIGQRPNSDSNLPNFIKRHF